MRALRILVIVLGVLLLAGTVALVVAIISRSGSRTAAVPPGTLIGGVPAASTVTLPAGAAVLSVHTIGPHVVVQVGAPGGAGGAQQLLVIDPASGALRTRIELRPE
jgi:hypothetical protein